MRNRKGKIIIAVFVLLCTYLLFFQAAEIRGEQYEGETDFIMVGLDKAKALLEEGAVFIDTRSSDEYEKLHIEGAVLISEEKLDKDLLSIIYTNIKIGEGCGCRGTSRKKAVAKLDYVVYGSESDADNVAAVAVRFREKGLRNVFIMRDGFKAWHNAGYYTETDMSF